MHDRRETSFTNDLDRFGRDLERRCSCKSYILYYYIELLLFVRQNAQRPAAVAETTGCFVYTALAVVVNSTARTPPFYCIGSHEHIYTEENLQ